MRLILMVLLIAVVAPLQALEDFDQQQILERIKPVGNVQVEQPTAAPAAAPQNQPEVKKMPGQVIYETYCSVCHRDGLAGAPKFHNKEDWQPRLDKKTLDELTATAIKGLNAMPPKGTCSECSEEDIKQAIQYMLPTS